MTRKPLTTNPSHSPKLSKRSRARRWNTTFSFYVERKKNSQTCLNQTTNAVATQSRRYHQTRDLVVVRNSPGAKVGVSARVTTESSTKLMIVRSESLSCISGIEKTFIRDRGPSRSKAQARS